MLECLIIGDSISVGVSQVKTECTSYSKSGINSDNWNKTYLNKFKSALPSKHVIISLGTNDLKHINTLGNVNIIRENISKAIVWWIVPPDVKPLQRSIIRDVAKIWGDRIIEVPSQDLSTDKVHPTGTGYRNIAKQIK